MRAQLVTMGLHAGDVRDVARGVRLTARPYVDRWGEDYLEPVDALRRASALLPQPEHADAITWVPGHDGSPGPGYELAAALAACWDLPLRECLVRCREIPSAHAAAERPSVDLVCESLAAADVPRGRIIVADNVIASGANMVGALRTLAAAGWPDLIALSVSVDPEVGSGAYLTQRGQRTALDSRRAGRWCRMPMTPALMGRECRTGQPRLPVR